MTACKVVNMENTWNCTTLIKIVQWRRRYSENSAIVHLIFIISLTHVLCSTLYVIPFLQLPSLSADQEINVKVGTGTTK